MIKITENLKVKGRLRITTYKSGTKEIINQTNWFNNLIVKNQTSGGNGINLITKQLLGTIDLTITKAKIGTGDTTPTDADTDLETVVLDNIIIANSSEINTGEALFEFFMTDAELANGDYTEFGMFSGTQLFCRAIITPTYTKATGQDTKVEYSIIITN